MTASTRSGMTPSGPVAETVHSNDGTEIALQRSGAGAPLILIVGAFNDRASTAGLSSGLADSFAVYEYDRRGRGDSGNTPPYSVEREVDDLAALIEAAGEPAFVFGHSSGGALALEAAAAGVPIRALAVHEPPYTGGEGATVEFAEHLERLVAEGRGSDAAAAFLELIGTPPAMLEQMRQGPHWARMERYAPTLSFEVRLCNDGVVPRERLAGIGLPALALSGENSPPWAQNVAEAVAEALPHAEARVLEGQSHRVDDDVLVPLLKGFFT